MNMSFWGWLLGAGVVAGALLLLLGTPANTSVDGLEVAAAESAVVEGTETTTVMASQSSYWEPVSTSSGTQVVTSTSSCSNCGVTHTVVETPQRALVSSCGSTAPGPCAATPCQPLSSSCCGASPCGNICLAERPGINRHFELCVTECSSIQLHSTVPHPICADIHFSWSASKGSFLDPTSSDPMFYAPTTHFADGEDVWVVLTITGPDGMRYTDQVKIHIVNR